MFKKIMLTTVAISALSISGLAMAKKIKIGFIVKQPESGWFQQEWKFAQKAADEHGFTLVKIGAQNGQKAMAAIDNLGAQQADGFVICTPDVKLGHAIVRKAKYNNLKMVTVDDRLVNGDGKPIASVPHMGASGYALGLQVGAALNAEMKHRHWNLKEVGAMALMYKQLPTAKARTQGAMDTLLKNHFPKANIYVTPHALDNTEQAFNAGNTLIAKKGKVKKWIVFGMNDEVVIGGLRALEGNGVATKNIIVVGINGTDEAINEFKKPKTTGFYASVALGAKQHGYDTAMAVYNWVKLGKKPPLLTHIPGTLLTKATYKAILKSLE